MNHYSTEPKDLILVKSYGLVVWKTLAVRT